MRDRERRLQALEQQHAAHRYPGLWLGPMDPAAADSTEVIIVGGTSEQYCGAMECLYFLGQHPSQPLPADLRAKALILPWAAYQKQR